MANPHRLFHVSDIHFGVEHSAAVAWFAEAVARERPDVVVCTGDLTQRATHEQFAAARDFFASLDTLVALAPGNHDMPYYNLWERFTQPYKRYGALRDAVESTIELQHCLLIPLKTTVRAQPRFPWSDGYVRKSALADTIRALRDCAGDGRYKFITAHHPLLPAQPESKNPTIGGETAFAALVEAGADAVLTGHVHVPFDLERSHANRALRMIGAGTLSTRLRGAEPGYNVVTYGPQAGVSVEQRVFGRITPS